MHAAHHAWGLHRAGMISRFHRGRRGRVPTCGLGTIRTTATSLARPGDGRTEPWGDALARGTRLRSPQATVKHAVGVQSDERQTAEPAMVPWASVTNRPSPKWPTSLAVLAWYALIPRARR